MNDTYKPRHNPAKNPVLAPDGTRAPAVPYQRFAPTDEVVRARLRLGWDADKAVSTPTRHRSGQKLYTLNGITATATAHAKRMGVRASSLRMKLSRMAEAQRIIAAQKERPLPPVPETETETETPNPDPGHGSLP